MTLDVEGTRVGMQVLVLGMPRTGTTSIRAAMQELGYDKHYYWGEMGDGEKRDPKDWIDLLQQKYNGSGKLITREQFNSILDEYTSCGDLPISAFAEDLIVAYPEAKVILSVRDSPDTWFKSFNDTIWEYQRPKFYPKTLLERFWARALADHSVHNKVMHLIRCNTPLQNFPVEGRQWYLDHNAKVRSLVPPDRLLEFNVKEGWDPLCSFLNAERPVTCFPRSNGTKRFRMVTGQSWTRWRAKRAQTWLNQLVVALAGVACLLIVFEIKHRASLNGLRLWGKSNMMI